MPFKNPEDKRKWRQRYWVDGRGKASSDKWKEKCKENGSWTQKKIAARDRARAKAASIPKKPRIKRPITRTRQQLKSEAIAKMGGCCSICGFDNEICLHFDHIEQCHRDVNGLPGKASSSTTHREVLNMDRPQDKFQLLCVNCHIRKTRRGNEWARRISA